MKYVIAAVLAVTMMLGLSSRALAAGDVVWDQGFETSTDGWFDNTDYPGYGVIERVATGTDGVTSSDGSWHAQIQENYPFSRFDGYRNTWPGTWIAEIDVYLDTDWAPGSGFDYSVAATDNAGNHRRDFIFHVTKDTTSGDLLVGASNNTNFAPREDLENVDHFAVTETGWYTLRHTFRDQAGVLAVDLQLVNSSGTILWTETRSDASDLISIMGGNRYSWFTALSDNLDLAVDNHRLIIPSLFQRTAEITSPAENANVFGTVSFDATLDDKDGDDSVQWAVRAGTCDANQGTVWGNVDGRTDDFDWDGATFHSSADTSSWTPGEYCYVFNPTESSGDTPIRLTRWFNVVETVGPPQDKNECKKDGWMSFNSPSFKNQGDCVSYVQSNDHAKGNKEK